METGEFDFYEKAIDSRISCFTAAGCGHRSVRAQEKRSPRTAPNYTSTAHPKQLLASSGCSGDESKKLTFHLHLVHDVTGGHVDLQLAVAHPGHFVGAEQQFAARRRFEA